MRFINAETKRGIICHVDGLIRNVDFSFRFRLIYINEGKL